MATQYYVGSASDWDTAANWASTSGGADATGPPAATDLAIFDANSGSCTLDAAGATCLGLKIGDTASAYTGTLDLATFDLSISTSGLDCTDGASATVDFGTGTTTCTGNWDIRDLGTFTPGTSTIVLSGSTKSIDPKNDMRFYNLTVSGTYDTASRGTGVRMDISNTLTISGTLTVTCNIRPDESDVVVTGTGTLAGTGNYSASIFGGSLDVQSGGAFTMSGACACNQGYTFVTAAQYSGSWTITSAGVARNVVFPSGTTTFTGSLEIESTGAGGTTVTNNTNNPSLVVQGDLTITESGGSVTWTKGTGTMTFSGTSDQTITTPAAWTDVMEDVTINKTAGNVTLIGNLFTESFTGTDGEFVPNGNDVTTDNNCDWAAAFTFPLDSTAMNGCGWDVNGNFTCDGQTLNATATWTLAVTGTAVASGAGAVAYSNATGTQITATSWTDNGNNTNWDFGGAAVGVRSIVGAGGLVGPGGAIIGSA